MSLPAAAPAGCDLAALEFCGRAAVRTGRPSALLHIAAQTPRNNTLSDACPHYTNQRVQIPS